MFSVVLMWCSVLRCTFTLVQTHMAATYDWLSALRSTVFVTVRLMRYSMLENHSLACDLLWALSHPIPCTPHAHTFFLAHGQTEMHNWWF